ncbi:MAG: hypothetical protein J0I31_19275 [Rhizobiales bacterium]|nr:hypothetical protein [Hyphomicrobiales bacterium]
MSFIRITCSRPGIRRAGVSHGAVATWPAGTFDDTQLKLLRADPAFKVEEVDSAPASGLVTLIDRSTVASVLRLLIPHSTVKLVEEMTEAVAAAIARGDMHEEFQPLAWDIFEKHALPGEGRSGTAREAPSADSGPEAEASGGVQPAAPQNTEGGAAGDAAHDREAPTTSEATTPRLGDASAEGAAAPETPAASAAGTDPNGEGGKEEEAAVRPAASAPEPSKSPAKARPSKAKG